MKVRITLTLALLISAALAWSAPASKEKQEKPLRIFIRVSEKTHGPGQHDYPGFLLEWTALLAQRGAAATGALRFPSRAELDQTDVLVLYAADGGNMSAAQARDLERFIRRGGGVVALHDAICGTNALQLKTLIGGAKQHGATNWSRGLMGLYVQDSAHPITQGVSNFDLEDELFFDLKLEPGITVLGTAFHTPKEIVPQMWVYEKGRGRAFVSLQGHYHATFGLPHYRGLLLRGMAWAGKRPVDSLLQPEELASFRYPAGGPTAPAQAGAKLSLDRDFNLNLVAAEPLVVKPISVDWDSRGRMWVALTPDYPARRGKGPGADSIVVLEDGNGDGVMDRRTVFADGLSPLTSFVFYRDGVIVARPPQILFLRDMDGDGRADRREVLFDGFGMADTHAVINNLRWGLDGWVYGCQGYSGSDSTNVVNGQGRRFGRIGNGIFRFRPDGSAMEPVASYAGNSWGIDFSAEGELFYTMANGPHVNHVVMPERYLARGQVTNTTAGKSIEDHQKLAPLFQDAREEYGQVSPVGVFTAASGCTIYEGGAWPEKYYGSQFVCEPTVHVVHEDILTRSESPTFDATRRDDAEFLAGTDLWFRPVHTRVGPDGGLYVLDFYNQAIAHNDIRGVAHGPGNAAVRPDRDHLNGRIWRVQHKAARPLAQPALGFASARELVQSLEHPNAWVRWTAQRLLAERQDASVAPELSALLRTNRLMTVRIHALWTLHLLDSLSDSNLVTALGDAHPSVQNNALQVVSELRSAPSSNVVAAVLKQLRDSAERTRLLALLALTQWTPTKESISSVHKLYPDLKDGWTKSAVLGMARLAPTNFIRSSFASDKPDSYRELVTPLVEDLIAKRDGAGASWLLAHTARQAAGTDKLKIAVLQAFSKHLSEFLPPASTNLEAAIHAFLKSGDRAVKVAAYPLATRFSEGGKISGELAELRKGFLAELDKEKMKDEDRNPLITQVMLIEALHPDIVPRLGTLLQRGVSKELQKHIITEVAPTRFAGVADILLGNYPKLTPENRALALGTLLRRREWTLSLLAALEKKTIPLEDLGVQGPDRLLHHPDAVVAREAAGVLGALRGPVRRNRQELIAQFQAAFTKPADVKRGKELFDRNCAICHKFGDKGRDLGPNLTGVGLHGEGVLLTHVLDPNRVVEGNYIAYQVVTHNQEDFTGIIKSENTEKVVLSNLEGDMEIKRADIETMRSSGLSLMPEGLEALGAPGIRDIVGYLVATVPRGFRPLDLSRAFTADSRKGLYEVLETAPSLVFKQYGIVMVDNIPFHIVNPQTASGGRNVVVLRGGVGFSKQLPQRVEFEVGTKAVKLYVLGGVAGWGFPDGDPDTQDIPAARARLEYADGGVEEVTWRNGEEFADYVRPYEVPGSKSAGDLLTHGQLRWFSVTPKRKVEIRRITLESFDNKLAPTFVAMTAQVE